MHSEHDASANLTILVPMIPDKRTPNSWRKSLIYVRDEKALSYLECRANLRLLPSEFKNAYHSRQKSPIFGVKSRRFSTKEPYSMWNAERTWYDYCPHNSNTYHSRQKSPVFGVNSCRFSTKEPYRCEMQSELDTITALTIQIHIILDKIALYSGQKSRRFSTKEPYNTSTALPMQIRRCA